MKTSLVIVVAAMLACTLHGVALAQENSGPQRPVSQQEIDQLKRQIDQDSRSSVEGVMDYHTETGDLNSRLDFVRYGGRLNLKLGPSTAFRITGTQTNYLPLSSELREHGTNITAALQTKLSESTEAHFEGGATRFSTDTVSINALASVTYNASDHSRAYATASRSNVEESLLSAVGIRPATGPLAGRLVGGVMENRVVIGGSYRLLDAFDVFGEGGGGNRAGSNVPSNLFKTVAAGGGYNIVSRPDGQSLGLLRAAYEFNYFGFSDDRSG